MGTDLDCIIGKITGFFESRQEVLFAYLFGSYASGCENSTSDIDIAVFFRPDYYSADVNRYLDMKMELTELLKKEIDLIILNNAKPLLKSRIINKHIRILSRDTTEEARFVCCSLGEYFDVEPYMGMQYKKVINQLKEGIPFG